MTWPSENKEIVDLSNKLFSKIFFHQKNFMGIKEPDEDKKEQLTDALQKYENQTGDKPYFSYLSTGNGHGPFTELRDGSIKYDLICSSGVNLLGHSHPLQIKSNIEAAFVDTMLTGNLLNYNESLDLAHLLLQKVSKTRLKKFYYAGSGSLANDNALKVLWQKNPNKNHIISFENSFAGKSVGTQNITYNQKHKEGVPQQFKVSHVPYYNSEEPDRSSEITISALEEIYRQDSDNILCICLELVQGEAGIIHGDKKYYKDVLNWAKNKNIYIWIDEIQTFARTHELFAFQMFELDELVDIVTVGKALQVCGTLVSDELMPKSGLISSTFNASIPALKFSHSLLRFLDEGNFYGSNGRISELYQAFSIRFNQLLSEEANNPKITKFEGIGTMIGFELNDIPSKDFVNKLFENGVIAHATGSKKQRVRFLLPITLKNSHIDEIFEIIKKTIREFS